MKNINIIDGHVDLLYLMMNQYAGIPFGDLDKGPITPKTLSAGKVSIFVAVFYCPDKFNGAESVSHFKTLLDYQGRYLKTLTPVLTKEVLISSYQAPAQTGIIFLLEN